MVFMVLFLAIKAEATKPPTIQIDTANFSIKINDKQIDHSKFNDVLMIIDREYRKVEKTGKTLYIFDEFGFTIHKEKKGITYSFLFTKGTTDDEPKNAFNVTLNLNQLAINSATSIGDLKKQLPIAEKTIQMENMFLYVNKKYVTMCESKDGQFIRMDVGFKTK